MARRIAALVFAWVALVVATLPANALDAVAVPLDGRTLDLTAALQFFTDPSERIQVSTAPGSDGIVRRIEVRSRGDSDGSFWAVLALVNDGDRQIDRLLVAPHFRLVGSGLLWPDLGTSRLANVTPSQGFSPERLTSQEADVFRVTLDPGAVITYIFELRSSSLPRRSHRRCPGAPTLHQENLYRS